MSRAVDRLPVSLLPLRLGVAIVMVAWSIDKLLRDLDTLWTVGR